MAKDKKPVITTIEDVGYRFEEGGPWQALEVLKNSKWYRANRDEAELFWRYAASAIMAEKAGEPWPPIK